MSNLRLQHATDDQLLHFVDGELPPPQVVEVRQHLTTCWLCRTEMEDIERTIGECARYRKMVIETCVPPPPAPWFDIYRHMERIDEYERRPHLGRRALGWLSAPLHYPRRWVPVTVILLLLAMAVQQFRHAPSVKAAEILHKAMAADDSRPPTPRRIQVRTHTRRLTRLIGSARALAQRNPDAVALAGLESLFRAAHYNWEDPLSAKAYSEWRDQLLDKRDEVTSEGDYYRLRTTTGSGELVEATLKLSSRDLRATEGTLQFRNREWVEIKEMPAAPEPGANAPEVVKTAPKLPLQASTPPLSAVQPPEELTPGDELQVLAALHRLGADLGDPVEVARSGGEILVTGTGIALERQREIRDELRSMPHVTVQFPELSAETPGAEEHNQRAISVSPTTGRLQTELEKQLGGRAAFEQFADHVLELTDAFMSRAHALRRLAERFPTYLEDQMTPPQRQLLTRLRREHAEAMLRSVTDVQGHMQPLLADMGAPPGAAQAAMPSGSWQDATGQLFGEARRAEKMLVAMLGNGDGQSPELPTQVAASLAQLRNRAESYDSLTRGR
jgi:anti-sigma factor RsiW